MQFSINDAQARALAQVLAEYGDGTDILLTKNGWALVVAFSLVTITIGADGAIEAD